MTHTFCYICSDFTFSINLITTYALFCYGVLTFVLKSINLCSEMPVAYGAGAQDKFLDEAVSNW